MVLAPDKLDPKELDRLLKKLTPREQAELDLLLDDRQLWRPLPGPQTDAYLSEADELFYGGSAGGGKTDLMLGLAATKHRKSIIFRREFPQLKDVIERSYQIIGTHGRYTGGQASRWRLEDGRQIEFGSVQYEHDAQKYQGRRSDFRGFDELPQFTESQYRFINGWLGTVIPGQRSRVVGAGNPPTNTEGEWVIRYWAPWLDAQHPYPAEPGELRWFATVDGKDKELESGTPFQYKGEEVVPRSRTFIPARLHDNPFLLQTGYSSVLQNMPEPLRSQMLYGDFQAGVEDDRWQLIPTAWVRAAMERWTPVGGLGRVMSAVGVDVARGGKDQTVLSRRYGTWFAELERHPGSSTPDGQAVSALMLRALLAGGIAFIDAIGVGASAYDQARQQAGGRIVPIIFSEQSPAKDRTGTLSFTNLRAYAYWSLREALDPVNGDNIALPNDRELLADLTAPRWTQRMNGIQVESKEDIIKRLGRSPDSGDAVVLAAYTPPKQPPQFYGAVGGERRNVQGYQVR